MDDVIITPRYPSMGCCLWFAARVPTGVAMLHLAAIGLCSADTVRRHSGSRVANVYAVFDTFGHTSDSINAAQTALCQHLLRLGADCWPGALEWGSAYYDITIIDPSYCFVYSFGCVAVN